MGFAILGFNTQRSDQAEEQKGKRLSENNAASAVFEKLPSFGKGKWKKSRFASHERGKNFPIYRERWEQKRKPANGHAPAFFVSYWKNGFYFATLLEGQISLKKHWAHLGLRAEQIRRP